MNATKRIITALDASIETKQTIRDSRTFIKRIADCAKILTKAFKSGKGVFLAGNGGSAADAQHIAAELSGKYYFDRPPLNAEALHVNTSYLTAVANDYGYNKIFARALEAHAKKGDVFIAISTSGNSENLIEALHYCREHGIKTIAMTGETGGKMKDLCDYLVNVPSTDTPRVQEAHITIGHAICEIVESTLFANDNK